MWTGTSLAGRSILRLQFANWKEKRQSRASGQPRGLEIRLLFCFAAAPRTFFYHRYIHRTRSIECRLADQSGALPTGGTWAAAPLAPPQGRHCIYASFYAVSGILKYIPISKKNPGIKGPCACTRGLFGTDL
jgi:hypothetical protein